MRGRRRQAQAGERWFLDPVLEGVYTIPGDGQVDCVGRFAARADHSGRVMSDAGLG